MVKFTNDHAVSIPNPHYIGKRIGDLLNSALQPFVRQVGDELTNMNMS